MPMSIHHVDAFSDTPFAGNPAAVCILREPAEESWMQNVASEMNLSETAFVSPVANGLGLRWFTPKAEVDLCGHATLATAHVLWDTGILNPDETARFHTKSGLIEVRQDNGWIEMDFPSEPPAPSDVPDDLIEGLPASFRYVGRNRMDFLVELEDESTVRSITPNMTALLRLPVRGIIVTSRSDSGDFDFVSRFFAPAVGVPEDPVTGSAHCALTPYWAELLEKEEMVGYQVSPRGGIVRVRNAGGRVKLIGQAITVFSGVIR